MLQDVKVCAVSSSGADGGSLKKGLADGKVLYYYNLQSWLTWNSVAAHVRLESRMVEVCISDRWWLPAFAGADVTQG